MTNDHLKTKDLMIGDWVIDSTGYYVKIIGCGCTDYNIYRHKMNLPILVDEEDDRNIGIMNPTQNRSYNEYLAFIKPIPITPKILEKNGFSDKGLAGWQNPDCDVTYYLKEHTFAKNLHKRKLVDVIHGIKYVNELQHALRLCGLTELADNFKV